MRQWQNERTVETRTGASPQRLCDTVSDHARTHMDISGARFSLSGQRFGSTPVADTSQFTAGVQGLFARCGSHLRCRNASWRAQDQRPAHPAKVLPGRPADGEPVPARERRHLHFLADAQFEHRAAKRL